MVKYSNMNDRTTQAFNKFSKSVTICIINRVLGIISILLIICSCLLLAFCFWLLTGSKYIENTMSQLCKDVDFTEFKNTVHDTITHISVTINSYLGFPFIPKTEIKEEFDESIQSHMEPVIDTSDDISDSSSDVEIVEMTVDKPKQPVIDLTNDDSDNNDTKTTDSYESLPEAMDEIDEKDEAKQNGDTD